MRFGWIGAHREGIAALTAFLERGVTVAGAITLTPDRAARRSAGGDYAEVCRRFGVPLHEVADINAPDSVRLLQGLALDVGIVLGWGQILREDALRCARVGMIGAHASLLPRLRGSAPINWAVIRGDTRTGNTLMWLAPGVDEGDIIDQEEFPITPYDTCASLYERVAESNRDMLLRLLPRLLRGERPGRRQPAGDEPLLPRRRPADGVVDWTRAAGALYDFVRALTRPYPGAFSVLEGRRWRIWHTARVPVAGALGPPGQVLGPLWSPVDDACGQLVACGEGALALLELENDEGTVLRGRALSEQPWTGKRWRDGEAGPGSRGAP